MPSPWGIFGGGVTGDKVSVDSSDSTPNFLAFKLQAGTNITFTTINPGGDEKIKIDATPGGTSDHKVAIDGADSTADFLAAKIAAGALIALTILNPGGNEQLEVDVKQGAANEVLVTDNIASQAQWAKIVNANVDTAAAIAGTKVSPAFGSQNISTSGSLTISSLGLGIIHSSGGGLFSSSLIVVGDITPGAANTVLTTDGAGTAVAWATIVNANVNAAAAIAGTKITPAFGSQNISTSGSLTISSLGLGVVHSSGGGLFSSSLIVNADVDAAAAIAGTKVSPAFGSQNISTSGSLTISSLGLGVVHSSGGGLFSSSNIVNADVDAAAAIAGTKISPDFGSQNVFTTGSIYSGTASTNTEQAGSTVTVSTGSTTQRGFVSTQHSTDANGAFFVGKKSRGTRGAQTTIVTGDVITKLVSLAYDGTNYLASAEISSEAVGTVAAGSVLQALIFRVGSNNSPTERFRIDPNAATYVLQGTGSMSLTGSLAVQSNPAQSGNLRVPNNSTILAYRNAANNADIVGLASNSSNGFLVGSDTATPAIQIRCTTTFQININGTVRVTATANTFEFTTQPDVSWNRNVASPVLSQQPNIAGASTNMWIHAQSPSQGGSNVNGGNLTISGGKNEGTGLKGAIRIAFNTDESLANVQPMVEVCEVIQGNRIVALCRAAALTSTQMPANTGDGVVYLANATTAPTADPVSGGILYASGGALVWRSSGGSTTVIAAS